MKPLNAIGLAVLCLGSAGLALAVYLHVRAPGEPGAMPLRVREEGHVRAHDSKQPTTPPRREPSQPLPFCDANQIARLLNEAALRVGQWSRRPALPSAAELAEAADAFHAALGTSMERQFLEGKAYIAAGDRALARLDFETAAGCFQAARLLDADDLDAAKGLATALTASARHEEAALVYRDLLDRLPEDATTKYNLAVALAKSGHAGEAQLLLAEVVEKQPAFLEAWYNLATLYTADSKLSRAREAWQKVTELSPKMAYPWMKLGEVLMDLEDANAARLAFAEATKRDPNDPTAYMNLAAASVRVGSFGQAVLATERAAALAPGAPGVWTSLGNLRITIYAATKEEKFLSGAVAAWERSLAIDPNQPAVKENLDHFRGEARPPATSGTRE